MSTREEKMLLALVFESSIVRFAASRATFPPRVGTGPDVKSVDLTIPLTTKLQQDYLIEELRLPFQQCLAPLKSLASYRRHRCIYVDTTRTNKSIGTIFAKFEIIFIDLSF
jgi:hypothetical protein